MRLSGKSARIVMGAVAPIRGACRRPSGAGRQAITEALATEAVDAAIAGALRCRATTTRFNCEAAVKGRFCRSRAYTKDTKGRRQT